MSIIISVCFFFFGAPSKTPTMLTAVPRMLNLFVEREGGGGCSFSLWLFCFVPAYCVIMAGSELHSVLEMEHNVFI